MEASAAFGVTPSAFASALWKAVVPPVTRSALQAIRPFAGVAQARVHVTLPAEDLAVARAVAGAAVAWPVVASPVRTSAVAATAADPMRLHRPRMESLLDGLLVDLLMDLVGLSDGVWGVVGRNGQPPGRG